MDIQDLPDPTIGKLELRDYGYTAEDMVALRKEAALDYHRMGSKIYCLGSDGGKGEYASKEMIQAHEGLFGMELQMWERIRDQDLDYADEDFGAFHPCLYPIRHSYCPQAPFACFPIHLQSFSDGILDMIMLYICLLYTSVKLLNFHYWQMSVMP